VRLIVVHTWGASCIGRECAVYSCVTISPGRFRLATVMLDLTRVSTASGRCEKQSADAPLVQEDCNPQIPECPEVGDDCSVPTVESSAMCMLGPISGGQDTSSHAERRRRLRMQFSALRVTAV
jgi:hypothetical protein